MFIKSFLRKVLGTSNERIVKQLRERVEQINALESHIAALSDDELRAKTQYLKGKLASGSTLDDILNEAFAVVREAAKRTLGVRHYDVQLIGGMVLHQGKISEMKTGEGKTLVATLPVYLNALTGKGVHVVTINDYLAKRDAEWMGSVYKFLGMTVGCIHGGIPEDERKAAYDCDITYGTNNEFGFDYLRDNLKYDVSKMVQREFNYAIVDEVDSILVDEARTPLVISGPTEDNSELYVKVNKLIPMLKPEDYEVDEKVRSAVFTDSGNHSIEELLRKHGVIAEGSTLYNIENMNVVHHINQALRAHKLFNRDVDYIVKDGKVMIIDEFTGRIMDGRRYSEGLHQALEAKEKVAIQNENQTLASITFQNYFRMYPKLAGMTGTAMTEAQEFSDIYKLEVVDIPTHMPVSRTDENDEVYLTAKEKNEAILKDIKEAHSKGQPILIGTVSIEKSEQLAAILKKEKIPHNVLNARYHEQEAHIIAQAGRYKAVTIATNMAGRGTDIVLGGNVDMLLKDEIASKKLKEKSEITAARKKITEAVAKEKQQVLDVGGLYVIGTERHESRRIDNQLRGRSGRQGDPGKTKFYLSMEDDLMRIFGSDRIKGLLTKLGLKEGEAIVHPWINKSLENAQKKVEARNYEIRKTLLRFDDVMNEQRKVIYHQRIFYLTENKLLEHFKEQAHELIEAVVRKCIPANALPEEWDLDSLVSEMRMSLNLQLSKENHLQNEGITEVEAKAIIVAMFDQMVAQKLAKHGPELMNDALKHIYILTLDQLWKDHLHTLDYLRTGIGLRAYAQKDPLNEYKIESFNLFKGMLEHFEYLCISRISHFEITSNLGEIEESKRMMEWRSDDTLKNFNPQSVETEHNKVVRVKKVVPKEERVATNEETWGRVARNEPCPCGSGKKYKHCHGVL